MPQDITLLEEISEQDLSQANGGTNTTITVSVSAVYSWYKGNKGYVCTATKECVCK